MTQYYYDDHIIQGGSIDNTPIGQTTPAAGSFTTLTATTSMTVPTILDGYSTTVTAAGTTTLTVSSNYHQFFTGTTTQTVKMPVTSTLVLGQDYRIVNKSTGAVTVTSSGDNSIVVMAANTECILTCILLTGTTAASWDYRYNALTALSTGTVNATTYGITSDGGTDDVVLVEATTTTAGLLGAAKWDEIVANSLKATNVTTNLAEGTTTTTTVLVTSSDGTDATLAAASTTRAGLLTSAKWDEIVANTLKDTNVSTSLSEGTVTETTVDVNSSDGSNATLASASTTRAGILTKAKWDEIVANSLKVTNVSTSLSEGTSTTTTVDVNSSDGSNATLAAASTTRAGLLTSAKWDEIVANSLKTGVTTQISNVSEDTSPALGGTLEISEQAILVDAALSTDHTWTGPTQSVTAGENLAIFETAYLKSDGKYWKIDASAAATATGKIVMATAAINAEATGIVLLPSPLSFIRDDSTDQWTVTAAGDIMYLSLTGGDLTNDSSGHTTTNDIVRVVGYMETAVTLNFCAAKSWVTIP